MVSTKSLTHFTLMSTFTLAILQASNLSLFFFAVPWRWSASAARDRGRQSPAVLHTADHLRGRTAVVRWQDPRLLRATPRGSGAFVPVRFPRALRAQARIQVQTCTPFQYLLYILYQVIFLFLTSKNLYSLYKLKRTANSSKLTKYVLTFKF